VAFILNARNAKPRASLPIVLSSAPKIEAEAKKRFATMTNETSNPKSNRGRVARCSVSTEYIDIINKRLLTLTKQ
jgi:hypothetical protein